MTCCRDREGGGGIYLHELQSLFPSALIIGWTKRRLDWEVQPSRVIPFVPETNYEVNCWTRVKSCWEDSRRLCSLSVFENVYHWEDLLKEERVLFWDESNPFHRSFCPTQSEFLYKTSVYLIIIFWRFCSLFFKDEVCYKSTASALQLSKLGVSPIYFPPLVFFNISLVCFIFFLSQIVPVQWLKYANSSCLFQSHVKLLH